VHGPKIKKSATKSKFLEKIFRKISDIVKKYELLRVFVKKLLKSIRLQHRP